VFKISAAGPYSIAGAAGEERNKQRKVVMVTPMLAELGGSIHVGLAGLGSAIGVGLVGMKASEAVGRNPGAFGKIITIGLIGMAFSEAIVFYALFLVKQQ
jgi:F-type H+-transporting ATPase subunit c